MPVFPRGLTAPGSGTFITGKYARLAIRDATNTWRDLTSFCWNCTVATKAGALDITQFGNKAKTFCAGMFEGGLITIQGFFDSGAADRPDVFLSNLISTAPTAALSTTPGVPNQSNYGQLVFVPNGIGPGLTFIADVVVSTYAVTAPTAGVVGFSLSTTIADDAMQGLTLPTFVSQYAYSNYVVHAPTSLVFSNSWINGALGAGSFDGLIGTTL